MLIYSSAFLVTERRAGGRGRVGPDAVLDLVLRNARKMRIAGHLPDEEAMRRLVESPSGDLDGKEDLLVRWATGERPRRWVLRIEHPSTQDARLIWTQDVACQAQDEGCRVGVRLTVEALDGGARPFDLQLTRPRIVYELVRNLRAKSGTLPLSAQPRPRASIPRLRQHLTDPSRAVPVILFGPPSDRRGSRSAIEKDVAFLAAGTAVLVAFRDEQDVARFNEGFDRALRFDPSWHLAIYWPIESGSRASELEERVVPLRAERGSRDLASDVLTRLAWRSVLHDPGGFVRLGLLLRETEARQSRSLESKVGEQAEEIALLEEEVRDLRGRLRETERDLTAARLELQRAAAREHALRSERSAPRTGSPPSHRWFRGWRVESVSQAVRLARSIDWLSERLLWAEGVERRARPCRFQPAGRALEALMFLGTTFLDRLREEHLEGRAQKEFARRYGFSLAPVERGLTRENPRAKAARRFRFGGREVVCEAHLKEGNEPDERCLRIHFGIEGKGHDMRILVGHVGGHLVTSGTGR